MCCRHHVYKLFKYSIKNIPPLVCHSHFYFYPANHLFIQYPSTFYFEKIMDWFIEVSRHFFDNAFSTSSIEFINFALIYKLSITSIEC